MNPAALLDPTGVLLLPLTQAETKLLAYVLGAFAASLIGLLLAIVGFLRLRSWAGERAALEELLYVAAPRLGPVVVLLGAVVLLQVIGLAIWSLAILDVLGSDPKAVLLLLAGLASLGGGILIFRWSLLVGQSSEAAALRRVSEKWQRQYR